jgi:hypothetical protein
VEQLSAALLEFERLSKAHHQEGSSLMSSANQPGWLFAEAAVEADRSSYSRGAAGDSVNTSSTAQHAAATAAAATATAGGSAGGADGTAAEGEPAGGLDQLLSRHVTARHLHMVSLHIMVANTLSRLQLAHLWVSRDTPVLL